MNYSQNKQKVTLGCGTLIIIALIVLVFGYSGNNETNEKLQFLQNEIRQLKLIVNEQNIELKKLNKILTGKTNKFQSTKNVDFNKQKL